MTIDEGTPVIVDDVRFSGFDVLDEGPRNSLKNVPLKAGAVRDRDNVKATRDVALQLLNNGGYPEAYVDAAERPNGTPDHVIVSFRADSGPLMKFGDVSIDGLKDVSEDVVRREVAFKTGATFKSGQVVRTQHRLSRLEVFQVVSVTARTEEAKGDRRARAHHRGRRTAATAEARARVRIGRARARDIQLAPRQFLRRRATGRGRRQGLVHRSGIQVLDPRALPQTTGTRARGERHGLADASTDV